MVGLVVIGLPGLLIARNMGDRRGEDMTQGAILPMDDEDETVVDTPGDDSHAWRMEYESGAYLEVAVFHEAERGEDPSDLIQIEIGEQENDPEPQLLRMHAHEAVTMCSYLGQAVVQLIEWGSPLVPDDGEDE